jgi:hypothetical protein
VAELKNLPLGVNTKIGLKNVTTSDNNVVWLGVFRLRNVPALSDIVDTFFEFNHSINCEWNVWIVPLVH